MAIEKNARIAVIDDDDSFRAATEWLIKAHGLDALGFASASAFLDEYPHENVDCIISDINMPGMSGLELKQCLNNRGSDIPVIFVSAQSDPSLPERVLQIGAAALLQKPFHGQHLMDTVNSVISNASKT